MEVDRTWWTSSYAVKNFIKLSFVDSDTVLDAEFLKCCCEATNWDFSLLFCYFNNRNAFLQYLSDFKGYWVIIIGPVPSSNIHTDPSPSETEFYLKDAVWKCSFSMNFANGDVVAFYTKF